ncbi:MAG: OmpA family protein [Gemmatimonadota bacterium]|jgi:outer membrane protein OmpA-like peptidoglycan-associated protein
MRHRTTNAIAALLVLPILGTGCASMTNQDKGVAVGVGAGAAAGAAVGKATGSTARGAIIGAIVGGTAGGIIGRQMDKQAEELADELPNATVERVGEGLLVTFDSGILFEFDSEVIKGSARDNLIELATSVKKYPDTELLIVGHTDAVGTDSYNQSLSERRSGSARRFLVSQGVTDARIRTEGRGEAEPVASNDTDAGRAQNRRVEVAIFASEAYRKKLVGG